MIVAEVIARNFYSRRNGVAVELPIGEQIVLKSIPNALSGKLRKVRDAKQGELIVNDDPHTARLKEEGKTVAPAAAQTVIPAAVEMPKAS